METRLSANLLVWDFARKCHIVLGVDWMKEVSPVNFDFNKMEVTLEKEGRRVVLQGNMEVGTCKMIKGKKL